MSEVKLDPEVLLSAYSRGAFPMADRDGTIRWYTADPRGILPLDAFYIPRTLRQIVRQNRFEIRIDSAFEETMRQCALCRPDGTWINDELVAAYAGLQRLGFAHSVECWREGRMVGGLYGVSLGGAFFGESMFHREANASKVALYHLVARLKSRGYKLLDTQATTDHLCRFGAISIPAEEYEKLLDAAVKLDCRFA